MPNPRHRIPCVPFEIKRFGGITFANPHLFTTKEVCSNLDICGKQESV